MRKLFFMLVTIFSGLAGISQDFHFSGFMSNLIFVNPAYTSLAESPEVTLTYRNQWPGIPATFVTYGAGLVFPVASLNSGMGVQVLNDVQGSGVITRTYAGIQYGYRINLDRDWQIGAGISATYVWKNFSADELVFRTDILNDLGYAYSPVIIENYQKSYPDFSIGVIIRNSSNISGGISVAHITRPAESLSDLANDRGLPLKYSGFLAGRIGRGSNFSGSDLAFEPAVYFSQQGKYQELIWGSQAVIASAFVIGGWIRQNLSFNMDALIFSAGISKERYNFLYSYDVNVKKLHPLSTKMGAHEVTFLYRFEYNGRTRGAVDCPAYD